MKMLKSLPFMGGFYTYLCRLFFYLLGVKFFNAGIPFRSTESRARDLVEIMDGDLSLGDPPDTVASRALFENPLMATTSFSLWRE